MTNQFPGPLSKAMLDELGQYVVAEPFPFVVDLKESQGMWLATVDGQKLFDWAGYYASKLLGHNHPKLYQPEYLEHLSRAANNKVANPDFLTRECLDYYRELHQHAPACMQGGRLEVYAVNSGAEAIENMMKYFINLYLHRHPEQESRTAARKFIYFDQAFHGRTVFALNVTTLDHDPVITRDFVGFDHGNIRAPFPAVDNSQGGDWNQARARESLAFIEDILKRDAINVVGIILEPLQGAGGHRVAVKEFYQRLSELAHRYQVSLGFDEVQTAGGQTGAFFAADLFDLPYPPQGIACAKKLACGAVYMLWPMEDHGVLDSTWGGTLADMVRFCQEMKIVREERLIEQVPEKSAQLVACLESLARAYPNLMYNIRGLGLYQGWSMRSAALKSRLQKLALNDESLLLLGAGPETIRLRPVLDVTLLDIDLLQEKLGRLLKRLQEEPE